MQIDGDVLPLAPLIDVLRQVRRKSPGILDESGMVSLAELLAGGSVTSAGGGGLFLAALELLATPGWARPR